MPELEHDAHDGGVDEAGREVALRGGIRGPPHTGGEDELAALHEVRDVGRLAHVHPADRAIERILAAQHLRHRRDDLFEPEHLADGGQHRLPRDGLALRGAIEVGGRGRHGRVRRGLVSRRLVRR
jgi:hypothetical protein